jgi:hypothetical protein
MSRKKKISVAKEVSQEELMKSIKKMEAEKRAAAIEKVGKAVSPADETVTFDAWWMLRSHKIPRMHMKEVIWADMKGRGLSKAEKVEDYDSALEKYGIKL